MQQRKLRKRKEENFNNRAALIGITLVVCSLAIAVHTKGSELRAEEQNLQSQEQSLNQQVQSEEERGRQLEEQRVYVQTKEYIEKVAKEKLGLVNKGEVILKPSETK